MASGPGSSRNPQSLAGVLASHELRMNGKSPSTSRKSSIANDAHAQQAEQPGVDALYERALPSLHFLRWRPMYHLLAPNGWMNDPCAPGYDPATGTYHLSFQWNPRRNVYGSVSWGSIAWGHATSKDLLNWTVSSIRSIKPGPWYDKEGCFTGCLYPTAVDGSPGLTTFYTGVSRLPLHYTLPYTQGTETLNMAHTTDGGMTWTKSKTNPILPEPPAGLMVTGWRDPYIAPWPSLDRLMGRPDDTSTLYGVISGGLKETGPTAFLYAINRNNLVQWMFVCPLVEIGLNHNISRWSGDMGINWECANFMTLRNKIDNTSREFIVVGGEGSDTMHPNSVFTEYPQQLTKFPRAERSLQWMCGSLHQTQSAGGVVVPRMEYRFGGRFDHGCLYGVNTFHDPVTSRQIAWGWITEEDLPQKLVDRQNWSGLMSLPRELSLICLRGVTGALVSPLSEITSIEVEPEDAATYTVRTLGISPASHVETLRRGVREVAIPGPLKLSAASAPMSGSSNSFLDVQTCRFELSARFAVSDTCERVGLTIFHTQDHDAAHATSIFLSPATETLIIERPDSSHVDANIHHFTEKAPFTLFTFAGGASGGGRETLDLRAWFDESVLELFANSRCTFATRVYPATKRCWGIRFWAGDGEAAANPSTLLEATVWDGLRADVRVMG